MFDREKRTEKEKETEVIKKRKHRALARHDDVMFRSITIVALILSHIKMFQSVRLVASCSFVSFLSSLTSLQSNRVQDLTAIDLKGMYRGTLFYLAISA